MPTKPRAEFDADLPPIALGRVASLGDGIFAVAMTMLAYNVRGVQPGATEGETGRWFATVLPTLGALALSFFAAGNFWMAFQRLLAVAPRRVGWGFVLPNLFFLLTIVVLPISTSLYGTAELSRPVVVIYGANLFAIATVYLAVWVYTRRATDPGAQLGPLLRAQRRVAYVATVFLAGTVCGWFVPRIAPIVWYASFGWPIVERATRRRVRTQESGQ